MTNDLISYVGISKDLPTNIKYFKEELFTNILNIENLKYPIDSIVSSSVDCKINSMKLINTNIRTSNEGQKLSGKKLLVDISIFYRIKYISDSKNKYLYVLKGSFNKVIYIVLPTSINEQDIEGLVRRNKVKLTTYLEDLYVEKRFDNSIYIRVLVLLTTNFSNNKFIDNKNYNI